MLSVQNLKKKYAARAGTTETWAVDDVSFNVKAGDIFTLLGPSGCGKSTILQSIAGLEEPSGGSIMIGEQVVYSGARKINVTAARRNIGMIFQSYAIWPHMSVIENVQLPIMYGQRRLPAREARARALEMLDLVQLADYADRPAPHLSGGQQQRVALARSLVHKPQLLLLDEPLSNLDATLRDAMRVELRTVIKALGTTTIFVTHDQIEAMAMSDSIALLRKGRVVQLDAPQNIYLSPRTAFAADFMGRSNLIVGNIGRNTGASRVLQSRFGPLEFTPLPGREHDGPGGMIVIRPHAIQVRAADPGRGVANTFRGIVRNVTFLGEGFEIEVELAEDVVLRAVVDPYRAIIQVGQAVWATLPPERCVLVEDGAPAETGNIAAPAPGAST